jgi:hypothetical protein
LKLLSVKTRLAIGVESFVRRQKSAFAGVPTSNLLQLWNRNLFEMRIFFGQKAIQKLRIDSSMKRNSRQEFMRSDFACEIELQLRDRLDFEYYWHVVMSRKFLRRVGASLSAERPHN